MRGRGAGADGSVRGVAASCEPCLVPLGDTCLLTYVELRSRTLGQGPPAIGPFARNCQETLLDRRVERTRNALIAAMRELLVERAWDKVSVRLICERADVSRSAFYAHCADRDEALDLAFDALRSGIGGAENVGSDRRGLDTTGTFRFLPHLVAHMRSHLPLFERNRESSAQARIYRRFRHVMEELANDEIARSSRRGTSEAVVGFAMGGVFALLERWCERGCATPDAELLDQLDAAIAGVLSAEVA